jgi:uncharacterized protein (TIGR02145 family)
VAAVAAVFCVGCGNPAGGDPDTGNPFDGYTGTYGTVSYGGKAYKTVKIGTQTWMAENLDYNVEGSKCHSNSADSCAKYGRLYNWATAMGIDASYNSTLWNGSDVNHRGVCPVGWHIPSDDEWSTLVSYVGGSSTAGTKLKSSTGWYAYSGVPAGTNQYGFSALPGGYGNSDGSFSHAGYSGFWWSATEYDAWNAGSRGMHVNDERVFRDDDFKTYLYSVRCVQD